MLAECAFLFSVVTIVDGESGQVDCSYEQILELDQQIVAGESEGRRSRTTIIALPMSLRAESAMFYMDLLDPNEEVRADCCEALLRFQHEYLNLQAQWIPRLWELAAMGPGAAQRERAALSHQRHEKLRSFDRSGRQLEEALFGAWREILETNDWFDAEVLRFVRHDRLRRRYDIWPRYALPEARPDVFDMMQQVIDESDRNDAVFATMSHYVAERGHLLKQRFDERLRIMPRDSELLAKHQDRELSWEEVIRQRSALRRRVVAIDSQLERLNQRTLDALQQELEPEEYDELRRTFLRTAHSSLFPDQSDDDFRRSARNWLEHHQHDAAATELISQALNDYERWYDERMKRLMRRVSRAEREFYLHLTFNAFEEDERQRAIAEFRMERDRRIERVKLLMDELSTRIDRGA